MTMIQHDTIFSMKRAMKRAYYFRLPCKINGLDRRGPCLSKYLQVVLYILVKSKDYLQRENENSKIIE